jgi:glycerol-1-phosphate dehydrogenase [NAD(P)+]
MDGFASDTAPIIKNNFKESWQAEQPLVIIGDTKVLAAAPAELKASGFGDMVAKYVGLAEWKIAGLLIGEYYCENIAAVTQQAVDKISALADKICENDEEAAGAVMESLVLTGLAMKLAGCSRPASGAEHVVSHYLECYKVNRGIWPEFHGKKVGVITVLLNRAYRNLAERVTDVDPVADPTDWALVYSKYDECMLDDVKRVNTPTITDKVDPAKLKALWPEIRKIIFETLPSDEKLMSLMKAAGAATTPEEVHVGDELLTDALRFHPYMRYRLLITRLMPMLGLDIMDFME